MRALSDPRRPLADVCGNHLLGRHRQLHSLQNRLKRRTYRQDIETEDWFGRMPELHAQHDLVVEEMTRRHYRHRSPIPFDPGSEVQLVLPGSAPVFTIDDSLCVCEGAPVRVRRPRRRAAARTRSAGATARGARRSVR